jgi:hypothetical protein
MTKASAVSKRAARTSSLTREALYARSNAALARSHRSRIIAYRRVKHREREVLKASRPELVPVDVAVQVVGEAVGEAVGDVIMGEAVGEAVEDRGSGRHGGGGGGWRGGRGEGRSHSGFSGAEHHPRLFRNPT